jgi:hypothetical protein
MSKMYCIRVSLAGGRTDLAGEQVEFGQGSDQIRSREITITSIAMRGAIMIYVSTGCMRLLKHAGGQWVLCLLFLESMEG